METSIRELILGLYIRIMERKWKPLSYNGVYILFGFLVKDSEPATDEDVFSCIPGNGARCLSKMQCVASGPSDGAS